MTTLHVPLVRPELGDAEVEAVTRVVRSGWLVAGPEVAALETEFASAVGARYAMAVANGTVALELALRCANVQPGDEVITVSHSFVATANVVRTLGATPVFVDIEPDTFGLDPKALASVISPRTRAILCVHQLGIPCDLAGIMAVAEPHGIPVIEDAACALGSEMRWNGAWERVGRPRGLMACFSFHPRKIVTTGEGGLITTNDDAVASRVRLLRGHGIRDGKCIEPAFNMRMSDVHAAIGRPQLARLSAIVAERRQIAAVYADALRDHPFLIAPRERSDARCNWQSYPVTVRDDSRLSPGEIIQSLGAKGLACGAGVTNAHQEPAYASQPCGPLPRSETARARTILLPLFHGMTADEVAAVVTGVEALAAEGGSPG